MTALEWLKNRFSVDEQSDTFVFGQANCIGILSVFLAIFGPSIQAALDASRNPVDDLVALPEAEKRGWGPYFTGWKARGL